MPMQFTAELTAVNANFQMKKVATFFSFCSKLRLWVEVKTAISEGSNGYPKSCFGAKKNKSSVSPCLSQFTT